MTNNKVFISGPMRGIADYNKPAFDEAEKKLKDMNFSVFNPSWLMYDDNWDRKDILAIDICALSKCRYILQLPGWEKASGARLEWDYASNAGILPLEFVEDRLYLVYPYDYINRLGSFSVQVMSAMNANRVVIEHDHWRKRKDQIIDILKQGYQVEDIPEQLIKHYHTGKMSLDTIKDQMEKLRINPNVLTYDEEER